MHQNNIKPLFTPLKDLLNFLSELKIKNVIIGGIAASILGKVRSTADIDSLILIDEYTLGDFINKAYEYGFLPRISEPVKFAQKNRVVLLKHKTSGINIDLSIGLLPFEIETLDRVKLSKIEKIKIPLPTPEDLIIMKAVAHRPIDMGDIKSILEVNPNLDFKRIKYWVREFAKVLEMPEIFNDLKKLFPKNRN